MNDTNELINELDRLRRKLAMAENEIDRLTLAYNQTRQVVDILMEQKGLKDGTSV